MVCQGSALVTSIPCPDVGTVGHNLDGGACMGLSRSSLESPRALEGSLEIKGEGKKDLL